MEYGFSLMGFLFYVLLLAPSFLWVRLPQWPRYRSRKKWIFAAMERIGLTAMFPLTLIFRNYDYQGLHPWLVFLILGWSFLLLYELHWIWCLHRGCLPMKLGPVPLTLLPVLAFVCLALYGKAPWLLLAVTVYGIGHVGGTADEPQENNTCPCCSMDSCDL